jgi:hypothetical protein
VNVDRLGSVGEQFEGARLQRLARRIGLFMIGR